MFVDERPGEASFTDLGRRLDQLWRLPLGVRWWWRLRLVVEGLLHDALRGLVFGSSIDLRGSGSGEWHVRGRNTGRGEGRVREGGRLLATGWGRVRPRVGFESGVAFGVAFGVGMMVWLA